VQEFFDGLHVYAYQRPAVHFCGPREPTRKGRTLAKGAWPGIPQRPSGRVNGVKRLRVKKQTKVIAAGPRVLSEIRQLIDSARDHVAVAANLSMVNLYWNIGRIITEDIQKNPERASYGDQLIEELGRQLTIDYGRGFSARNLWDMKRFSAEFQILQAPPAESPGECQQRQPPLRLPKILQALPAESGNVITIEFRKHYHLGWTHYRILMGLGDPRKRVFYLEQAAAGRWSTRELERRIAGALFERVALSRDTRNTAVQISVVSSQAGLILLDKLVPSGALREAGWLASTDTRRRF
jgi:hypothetical protein